MLPSLGVAAAAVLFSTGGAAIKANSLSGWQVASYRSAIAAVLLASVFPKSAWPRSLKEPLVGLAYSATMLLFVHANKLTTAADAIFLQSSAPVYVLLLAPWLLAERVRPRDLGLLAAVAAGVALCVFGARPASATAPRPFLGDMLGLCSGVTWALTLIGLRSLARREGPQPGTGSEAEAGPAAGAGHVRGRNPAVTASVWGNVLACLASLPMALSDHGAGASSVHGSAALDLLVLLYLGVFQIGLAYIFLTWAMKRVRAIEAALLLQLEPALNPVWAWLAHGEAPGLYPLVGGIIILTSALAATVLENLSPGKGRGNPGSG